MYESLCPTRHLYNPVLPQKNEEHFKIYLSNLVFALQQHSHALAARLYVSKTAKNTIQQELSQGTMTLLYWESAVQDQSLSSSSKQFEWTIVSISVWIEHFPTHCKYRSISHDPGQVQLASGTNRSKIAYTGNPLTAYLKVGHDDKPALLW